MEEKFRMELLAILNKGMDKEQINAVDMALTALFQRYEVSEQCTDLVVLDDCNDKIINTYIASMRLEGRSEKTLKQYYDALTKLLEEIPKNIRDIKTNDIRYHLAHYQSTHKVSNATVNNKAMYYLERYLPDKMDASRPLFLNGWGKSMTKGNIEQLMRDIGKRAGVSKVHPHRFRRTMATNAMKRGMPVQYIQVILGHSKLDTTMIYCIYDKEMVKAEYLKVA